MVIFVNIQASSILLTRKQVHTWYLSCYVEKKKNFQDPYTSVIGLILMVMMCTGLNGNCPPMLT